MGCPSVDARVVAEALVAAELRGIPAHGVARVGDLFMMKEAGRVKTNPNIGIIYQSPTTATMDGDSCFGPVVAKQGMALAIEKAHAVGTGWVAVRGSNYFGISAFYSMMALERDMVGIVLTNTSPQVAPVFGASRMLGVNPISVAIPALLSPPVVFDFATTAMVPSQLDLLARQELRVPQGLVQDALGKPTDDPATLSRGGAILPLGGDVEHGAHKGFCIGALVDIFSALFSGACFASFVPSEVSHLPIVESSVGKGVGHFFGAIRVDAFRPSSEFRAAMDEWIETFRNARGINGLSGVIIPGETQRLESIRRSNMGIPLAQEVVDGLNRVAERLGCSPLSYQSD